MKFGANCSESFSARPLPGDHVRLAQHIESLGYSTLWLGDHIAIPPDADVENYPYDTASFKPQCSWPDQFIVLAAAANATTRIRLGTGVTVAPYRQPIQLAQTIATLDLISGGRFVLGVGVGWSQKEFEALGVPFNQRGARTNESIRVLRALWQDEVREIASPSLPDSGARLTVFPWQKPSPKILIGGEGDPMIRRTAELGDGIQCLYKSPEELRNLLDSLRREMDRRGRNMDALEITLVTDDVEHVLHNFHQIRELQELGVSEVVFSPKVYDLERSMRLWETIANSVLA
ncbi:TIGR03619 family F420-dependent LLM class oxidoreductase [Rhizorhabdus argentea]|uniref:TIGR03619 family F420-dependent LLM class oxidoreductase n=1 Tax=Rhizorhabdus argentea TaxID=1387174 RepID=UPI0030EC93E7